MKSRRRQWFRTLLALGCLVLGACASHSRIPAQRLERARQALLQAGDADSLAAAAVFVTEAHSDAAERYALMTRAVTLAPDRVDLRWLQIAACHTGMDCDRVSLSAALLAKDPGNAAAWMAQLDRGVTDQDTVAVDNALRAMTGAERFDVYWTRSNAHLSQALLRVYPDESSVVSLIAGGEAAVGLPAFKNLSGACRGAALDDADRLATCRSIAAVLRRGDTYLAEGIGLSIAERVWPADSPEHADALETRRTMEYREFLRGTLLGDLRSEAATRQYRALLGSQRSEQDVTLGLLAAAQLNPIPPPDWRSMP